MITLSHAQNFVQFGTIGVSPGDRVEGFSSPLQFILSSVYFFLFDQGYGSFLDLQVAVCIVLNGAFIALSIYQLVLTNNARHSRLFAASISIPLCLLAGIATASSWTATGWLVSGMENPLAIVIGSAIVYLLTLQPRPVIMLAASALVTVLGITRVEFPAFALPLSVGIALFCRRNLPAETRKFWPFAIGLPLVTWTSINLIRLLYFGHFLPNTALVQDKSSYAGIKVLILLILYFIYAFYFATITQVRNARIYQIRLWRLLALACVASLLMLTILSGGIRPDSSSLTNTYSLGLLAMACILSIMQYLNARAGIKTDVINFTFGGLVFIPVAQFLVMGPARMEDTRVLSLATPWMAAWISLSIASLAEAIGKNRLSLFDSPWACSVLIPIAAFFGIAAIADKPRDMPWIISPREERILAASDALKARMLKGSSLILVANPDLGKISFPKKAVITDLGWLGDPLLTRISKQSKVLESVYLNEVAKPDIVGVHGRWSCRYENWLLSNSYRRDYILVDLSTATAGRASNVVCPLGGRSAIWERKPTIEAIEEYGLTKALLTHANPINAINKAIEKCLVAGNSPFRCSPVRRSIQRAYLRLKHDDFIDKAIEALKESPSYRLDSELLVRSPGWGRRGYEYFMALASEYMAIQRESHGSK